MAVSLKIGVGYLFSELFAHTFVIRVFADAARAVPVFCFQTRLDGFYDFFIGIKLYLRLFSPF